jgi:hypothetical protein
MRVGLVGLLWVLIAACGGSKEPPRVDPGPASGADGVPMDAAKQAFMIDKGEVPDEPGWNSALTVVTNGWTDSFNKLGVTTAKVSPLKSKDGTIAKYLLQVEATKGTEVVFRGVGLVSKGTMINGSGLPRLEAHFAALKFPKETKLTVGHLLEMFQITGALGADWVTPGAIDWDFDKPRGQTRHVPATLTYDDKGALLTVYRDGKAGTPPPPKGSAGPDPGIERLEVRIDPNGLVTKTAARKASGSATWEPFTE